MAAKADQFRHDNTTCPLAPRTGESCRVVATSGRSVPLTHAALFYTTNGSGPTTAANRVPLEKAGVDWDVRTGFLNRWEGEIPGQPAGTTVRYRIGGWCSPQPDGEPDLWAQDGQGFWFRTPPEHAISTFGFAPGDAAMPRWMRDAVIYQIFLDRFHPGTEDGSFLPAGPTDLHGGTINGVRQALPYLTDLGVTCLWLSPLAPAESYHRYDGMDYQDVDPALGSLDDLKALVREVHGRGMRIWLDYVPSHCSWHHPAFLAAQRDQTAPSSSWFTFYDWPNEYRSFLNMVPVLPSFNGEDPGARAYLTESALFWAREVGVDGFRLDHAIGMSMDFWTHFRTATKGASADFVNVGEATDTPDSLRRYRGRLDGILDFPLATALRSTFASCTWDLAQLDGFLAAYDSYMEDGPGRVSFLDNHDMNRFMFLAGDDPARLKMAALCQFTLSPTPVLYYGTEVGLSHRHDVHSEHGDSETRGDMPWDPASWNVDLLAFYRDLIAVRRRYAPAWSAPRETLHLDSVRGTYVYRFGDLAAAFNTADEDRGVSLSGGPWRVLLGTDRGVIAGGREGEITLPPRSAVLLEPTSSRASSSPA